MKLCIVISTLLFNLCSGAVENFVGFTAFNSFDLRLDSGDPVIFDSTIVNQGLHYDAETGVFTCPFNGIYYISVSFRKYITYAYANIRIDGNVAFRIDERSTSNDYAMVSGSSLVRCETDQEIDIVATGTFDIEGGFPPLSTYTVMLVLQTETGEDFIGVTAFKQSSEAYNGGETIQLNGIVWSNGEDYEDGVFTCPISGMYFISYQFQRVDSRDMFIDVVKNGSEVLLRTADGRTDNRDGTRSNSRLVTCMAGETLSVKAFHTGSIFGAILPTSTFTVMYVADVDAVVGFTSSKVSPDRDITVGQPMVLETTLEDGGGYYDNNTGIFTCQAVGIYYVALNLQRTSTFELDIEVMRGSVPVVLMEDDGGSNEDAVMTITALTPCLPGEQITVEPYDEGGVHGSTYPVTTWTVVLMYEY